MNGGWKFEIFLSMQIVNGVHFCTLLSINLRGNWLKCLENMKKIKFFANLLAQNVFARKFQFKSLQHYSNKSTENGLQNGKLTTPLTWNSSRNQFRKFSGVSAAKISLNVSSAISHGYFLSQVGLPSSHTHSNGPKSSSLFHGLIHNTKQTQHKIFIQKIHR